MEKKNYVAIVTDDFAEYQRIKNIGSDLYIYVALMSEIRLTNRIPLVEYLMGDYDTKFNMYLLYDEYDNNEFKNRDTSAIEFVMFLELTDAELKTADLILDSFLGED